MSRQLLLVLLTLFSEHCGKGAISMKMKLKDKSFMHKYDELTRGAFVSYMKDYMKQLLTDPIHANVNDFLKSHGITNQIALSMLLKKQDKNDDNSAVLVRSEKIIDNGLDEDGNKLKDTFSVTYKAPRKYLLRKLKKLYGKLYEYSHIVNDKIGFDIINEDGECCDVSDGNNGGPGGQSGFQYDNPINGGKPIKRTIYTPKTVYITQEQAELIKETINMDFDSYGYDVPMSVKKNDPSLNHKDMMKKSWVGEVEEDIDIKPENKGKFTQTKKRTGKSTEELTHSKNPLTKKRAIFSQNAKKWNHKGKK